MSFQALAAMTRWKAIAALVLVLVALATIWGLAGRRGRPAAPLSRIARSDRRALAAGDLSPVGPTVLARETPDEARAFNASVPFVAGTIPPARPFAYVGSALDRAAATACLAAAALYEAGDDAPGEQAVAQVVINRLRHPAFPKTVCGVVFQGSERVTGCQFTFTCDGSLARAPGADAWQRAMRIAAAALSGVVYAPVGAATHYHADWVVPYWHASLEKVAQVHGQIFYRWPGRWGTPAVLAGRPLPGERIDPRLGPLAGPGVADWAPPDALGGTQRAALAIEGVPPRALKGNIVRLKDDAAGQYVVQLDPAAPPGSYATLGFTICGGRADCLVLGWTAERETPLSLPVLPFSMRTLAFLYRKSSMTGTAQPVWDCTRFARPIAAQCLPGTARGPKLSAPRPSRSAAAAG